MAANSMEWSPDFCLACDRQTDGNAYCSEACRLAEYEVSGSAASSPMSAKSPSWPTTRSSHNGFYMEPAYNFSQARTTQSSQYQPARPRTSPTTRSVLTPSSSQSSLFSMQSTTSTSSTEQTHLSDESRRALREYASAFDQSRYTRRKSTH